MLKKRIKNKVLLNIVEFAISLAIAAAAFFIIYNFVARTGMIKGISMEPTLSHGEIVLINKMAYWFVAPKMGDIVAFPNNTGTEEKEYVKRVIGVPGDEIDYRNGIIYKNGELLPEEYRMEPGGPYAVDFPLIVPEGTVFVLGDNRWASEDSRNLGCISVKIIRGKIPMRFLPISKFGLLK